MRVAMVHQPHFLPWPGYLARCLAVDVFVALDNVKLNHNEYQRRTRYVDRDARLRWLSLPVARATRSGLIQDVRIAEGFSLKKWQRPVVQSYRDAPFFDSIWNEAMTIVATHQPSFCEVSLWLISWMLDGLCASLSIPAVDVVRGSQLVTSDQRTARLVDVCRSQGATHLVMGRYALESHDIGILGDAGLSLMSQRYVGPEQSKPSPGVMALHYLAHSGWDRVARDLASHWILEPIV